jgi:hypothetical protein
LRSGALIFRTFAENRDPRSAGRSWRAAFGSLVRVRFQHLRPRQDRTRGPQARAAASSRRTSGFGWTSYWPESSAVLASSRTAARAIAPSWTEGALQELDDRLLQTRFVGLAELVGLRGRLRGRPHPARAAYPDRPRWRSAREPAPAWAAATRCSRACARGRLSLRPPCMRSVIEALASIWSRRKGSCRAGPGAPAPNGRRRARRWCARARLRAPGAERR